MPNYDLHYHANTMTLIFRPEWCTKDKRSWPQLGAATFKLGGWHVEKDGRLSFHVCNPVDQNMGEYCADLIANTQDAVHMHMEFVFNVVDIIRGLKQIEG